MPSHWDSSTVSFLMHRQDADVNVQCEPQDVDRSPKCDGEKLRRDSGFYDTCRKMLVVTSVVRFKQNRLSDLRNMLGHIEQRCPDAHTQPAERSIDGGGDDGEGAVLEGVASPDGSPRAVKMHR